MKPRVRIGPAALTGLLALGAVAQAPAADLVLAGQVNIGLVRDNNFAQNYGGQVSAELDAGHSLRVDGESSFYVLRGVERLPEQRAAATFVVQTGLDPTTGVATRMGKLETWVGLKHDDGHAVALGHGKSLYTRAYEMVDRLSGDFTVGINGYGTSGSALDDGYGDDGYLYRIPDCVRYTYDGETLYGGVEYAPSLVQAGTRSPSVFNAVLRLGDSHAWIEAAADVSRDASGVPGSRLSNLLVAGAWTVGGVEFNLALQRHAYRRPDFRVERWSLASGIEAPVGPVRAYANWVHAGTPEFGQAPGSAELPGGRINHFGAGVRWDFSKRTSLRAEGGGFSFSDPRLLSQRTAMVALFHRY